MLLTDNPSSGVKKMGLGFPLIYLFPDSI